MAKKTEAKPPSTSSLKKLSDASQDCTACELYKNATQAVFGHGEKSSRIMIVGEQPGDKEDLQGLPFVGPAGELLRRCIEEAGIDMNDVYLTNAVKHFKWRPAGKTRLHQKPSLSEIRACHPWLEAEMNTIKPKVIVALGATGATGVLGRVPKITIERGKVISGEESARVVIISWHPSAILRGYDREDAALKRKQLVTDLKLAKKSLGK